LYHFFMIYGGCHRMIYAEKVGQYKYRPLPTHEKHTKNYSSLYVK
jgi:hypothetical protein